MHKTYGHFCSLEISSRTMSQSSVVPQPKYPEIYLGVKLAANLQSKLKSDRDETTNIPRRPCAQTTLRSGVQDTDSRISVTHHNLINHRCQSIGRILFWAHDAFRADVTNLQKTLSLTHLHRRLCNVSGIITWAPNAL